MKTVNDLIIEIMKNLLVLLIVITTSCSGENICNHEDYPEAPFDNPYQTEVTDLKVTYYYYAPMGELRVTYIYTGDNPYTRYKDNPCWKETMIIIP